MTRRVVRTPLAERDLIDAWIYIAEESEPAADDLLHEIAKVCEQLAAFPLTGRSRDELLPGIRSRTVANYLILYRPNDSGIEVIRVLHGARDIESLFDDS